ncbi:MAG TPA: DUF1062 domain-containing protein [Eubacteriales bacterium]|nr:DUF1062 domain-containing protein [Eubacteriales bacterium]
MPAEGIFCGLFPFVRALRSAAVCFLSRPATQVPRKEFVCFNFIGRSLWTPFPVTIKKCTRCGGELFENSGAFRVNANGKRLDVWLICRCTNCKTTWNLAVYERINRSALGETTYAALLENDAALAMQISLNRTFLMRNRAVIDVESLVWHVLGETMPHGGEAQITVTAQADLPVPAVKIIAQKLGLSSSRVKALIASGTLLFDGNPKKKETGRGFVLTLLNG